MERRILYLQYTDPAAYPPLEHSSRILARRGWGVLFLGTGSFGADSLRFSAHPNIAVRRMRFCPGGWRQKLHYVGFGLWVIGWVVRWRPQWVYASDLLSCPVALVLSAFRGLRVIYHEHDSPDALRLTPSRFTGFLMSMRRRLAGRAVLCVVPNEERAGRLKADTAPAGEVLRVWNCPAAEEVRPARAPRAPEELWVLYHGSIVPARLPPSILGALAMLPEAVKLRVVGYEPIGHLGYVQQLRDMARQLGVSARVQFVGTVPDRAELLEWCARSDVGLALMPKFSDGFNEQTMAGASNKPFDYLACGLALLVSDLPDWRAMFAEPGYAVACDPGDPGSLAEALRWFADHPDEMRRMGDDGRQRIAAEWNYETQFVPVCRRIEEKLGGV